MLNNEFKDTDKFTLTGAQLNDLMKHSKRLGEWLAMRNTAAQANSDEMILQANGYRFEEEQKLNQLVKGIRGDGKHYGSY